MCKPGYDPTNAKQTEDHITTVGSHAVTKITPAGAQVGCTWVPKDKIEELLGLVKNAKPKFVIHIFESASCDLFYITLESDDKYISSAKWKEGYLGGVGYLRLTKNQARELVEELQNLLGGTNVKQS